MMLGSSYVFEDVNRVVEALERESAEREERAPRRIIVNAHQRVEDEPFPPGYAVIYNFENPGGVGGSRNKWQACEVWDFHEEHARQFGAKYVPIGWHPAWKSFERAPKHARNIDVSFFGTMNPERQHLRARLVHASLRAAIGLEVYGRDRDEILSRTRVGYNMLFYPNGAFPALRVAHLVANGIPVVSEDSPGAWPFLDLVPKGDLFRRVVECCTMSDDDLDAMAARQLEAFRAMPMVLP